MYRTILALSALGVIALAPRSRAAEPIDFQRDIRPILADNCFTCHGFDDKARKGKLRLDIREDALRGGTSGDPAIVPGKVDAGQLIARIISNEAEEVMPPPSTKKKLTPLQIEKLRQWVASGAEYKLHWGFIAPKRSPIPNVNHATFTIRNPIDAFVMARLRREKMEPSPQADRVTLIRRLSLDLIGLPPTIEEVDAFVNDRSADAYEKLVDRLLASPHYGERWGRHWLDAARYADSDGYEKDKPRNVWMYRDWVVNAHNHDLAYDQFLTDQLAGDLLPNPTQDQLVATGFMRNSMINEEGGIDPEQFRMEAMFDRMDAIGKSMLGLTINCCQCHSHKYDPFTQEEYYRLFAYLNDTHESNIAVYTPMELQKLAELFQKVRMIEDDLKHRVSDWQQKMNAWEDQVSKHQPKWDVLKVQNAGDNSQRYVYHEDGSQTAWGYAPTKWSSQFRGTTNVSKITAIRLEMLTDPNLPLNGPGRSPTGLFALSEITIEVADAKTPDQRKPIKLIAASADFGNEEKPLDAMYDDRTNKKRVTGPVTFAIDGKDETAWGIDAGPGRRNVDRKAVFILETPITFPEGAVLTFNLKQMHGGWNSDDNQNNNLGRFRFSVTNAETPKADPIPKRLRELFNTPRDQRTPAQIGAIFQVWRASVNEWKSDNEAIEALWKSHPEGTAQLAMAPRESPRTTFLLKRGDFLQPAQAVRPGTPSILHPQPNDALPNRLGLAKWMTDRNSPTTSRSFVNRVWQTYFGIGLVSTSEDLGVQSEIPTHPELLDWLAIEFMERGWSMKSLHKLIVTSSTYRQSSKVTPEQLARDPFNRYLGRASRFRVEGEVVRDVTLAASGLLNARVGGPPVFPPAPEFLFRPPISYGPKVWNEDKGPGRYRRGIYTFRFRSVPYPVLTNFDTPNGDASCVKRVRSNTPLQALTSLNETLFLESSRALALELVSQNTDDRTRMITGFRRCVSRTPTDRELQVLMNFLAKQSQSFAGNDAKAWELIANDPANPPKLMPGVTVSQVAAWTATARLLLNLDETITRE